MKYLILSCFLSVLAMCSTPKDSEQVEQSLSLAATNWKLERFQAPGQKMMGALNDKASLSFGADGSIGGDTGCNGMGGNYQLKGNQVTIEAFTTKIYCEEVALQETAINEVMNGAMTASLEGGKLTLRRAGGQLVYVKAPKVAAVEKSMPATGGGGAPTQYDQNPATTNDASTKAATTAAATTGGNTTEMTGLFRYMADAAVFIRCSDQKRFGVVMSGNFSDAEKAYTRMEKNGAPALMSFEVEISRNEGEGFPELITILQVVSSSSESECQ